MSDSSVVSPSTPAAAPANEGQQQAAPKAEAAPESRKHKVNVYGQEREVSEADLLRDYTKYAAADQKFNEAAMSKKQVENFMKALQEDPDSVLSNPKLGLKRRELAEKWLREELENEMMDPAQRALRDKDAELQKYKSKEQKEKEEVEAKEMAESQKRYVAHYDKTIGDALNAGDFPKNASTVKEIAYYIKKQLEAGWEPDVSEIVAHVKGQFQSSISDVFKSLKGKQLLAALPKEFLNELRKADLEELRSGREPRQQVQSDEPRQPRQSNKPERFDAKTARDQLRKM